MKYELFEYQREAAVGVLTRLERSRRDWRKYASRSSFALSAATGSGKTVIATAVIEAVVHGSSDLGIDPDGRAVFLWVTDDPALNRQTRSRMLEASDLLNPGRLVVIDNDFLERSLLPGFVYFINVQKLSKSGGLSKSDNNLRQNSFWKILANTIDGDTADLYLVLDEAHRGMRPSTDRKTIVRRIIDGRSGENPALPCVWGISATIERFTKAMNGGTGRTSYEPVQVDIDAVRASGLIKDHIDLTQPSEEGNFTGTLLREAVKRAREFDRRWSVYSEKEREPTVAPVLVVQVPDKASPGKLGEIVDVISHEWPDIAPSGIVHVFGEHEPVSAGSRKIDWIEPERIQTEPSVRVVLAKEAISTGWDCPRAEVLYSERPARDATHIAQVVGRMVRQPLAYRITTDDVLNGVNCYLPLFAMDALERIIAELSGKGAANGDSKVGSEVRRETDTFARNPEIDNSVFTLIESLPSLSTPSKLASPLRRARKLAKLLSDDSRGPALLADAGAQLTSVLNNRLNGLAAEHKDAVATNVKDLQTAETVTTTTGTEGTGTETRIGSIASHFRDVERASTRLLNTLKEGAGKDYYRYRVAEVGESAYIHQIRTEVAALLKVDGVVAKVEEVADAWCVEKLAAYRVAIKAATGATRDAYRKVQEETTKVEVQQIELPDNLTAATTYTEKKGKALLPRIGGHVYCDEEGFFPVELNEWETNVVETEIGRGTFVSWYRNPSRAVSSALKIAYEKETGDWSSLQVDYLVISRRDDGSLATSIVDPHSAHLADSAAKLRALAEYAESYSDSYDRIESINKVADGSLRVLDMLDERVRAAVRAFDGTNVGQLYESGQSRLFV